MDKDAVNAHHIPHITITAVMIGALFSVTTMWWSMHSTPELPLTLDERAHIRAQPGGVAATLREVGAAIREIPPTMRQLWWMKLFQWYGMLC